MAEVAEIGAEEAGAGEAGSGGGSGSSGISGLLGSVIKGAFDLGKAGIEAKSNQRIANIYTQGAANRQSVADAAYGQQMQLSREYGLQVLGQQNDYQTQLLNMRDQSFKDTGLPTYLGWIGDSKEDMGGPKYIQMLGGQNEYASKLIGDPMSARWTGDLLQSYYGWGAVNPMHFKSQ